MGGSAENAALALAASGGPRMGTARTASTTTPSTALGLRETGWPGAPWTEVAQLPMTIGGAAAAVALPASRLAVDPAKTTVRAAAKVFTRRRMVLPPR